MRHSFLIKAGSVAVATALASCIGVSGAFAANMSTGTTDANTSWPVPTAPVTNTIVKDGKLCKVLTNWSNAWATNGSDYLGISNSSWLQGNGGGDFATTVANLNKTLSGVFATSVNENPNAYQWNQFYNLFATVDSSMGELSDTATVEGKFSTEAGVYGPLTYRPELIWYSNSFAMGDGDNAVQGAVKHINNGEYYTGTGEDGTNTYNGDKSTYYVYGDETYDPYKVVAGNGSPLRWVTSLNTAAHAAEDIIDDTADYNADGAITEDNVDKKNMNQLPRASRYDESPVECAVNVEKVTKGSVYYVLSQIAAGKVDKKTVAYVEDNTLDTTNTTTTVVAFDYTEQVGQGKMQGTASFSPLAVNQLTTSNVKTARQANSNTGGANLSGAAYGQASQDLPYTEYYATADELLACDYIYDPNGASADAWTTWLSANATGGAEAVEAAQAAGKAQVISTAVCIMQTSNFTAEKLAYGVFAVNSFYPELFPNMTLMAYWYDNVYHIKTDSVATVTSWALANASLTKGNELSGISNYSRSNLEGKFDAGLTYYNSIISGAEDTEGTITRVLSGYDLDGGTNPGSTTESTLVGGTTITTPAGAWNFTDFAPSSDWSAAEVSSNRLAGETRYDTMKQVILNAFSSADTVILATGENYADALAGASIAGLKDAPVVLTKPGELSDAAKETIEALGATKVIIVGGTAAVSADVEAQLSDYEVKRISGETRIDTALKIYEEGVGSWGSTAIVACANNFADALAVSPYAFNQNAPIFLAGTDGLTEEQISALEGFDRVVICGGDAAVPTSVDAALGDKAERLAGSTRIETAQKIAEFSIAEGMTAYNCSVANANNYPDALAGGAACGKTGTVMLLVNDSSASSVAEFLTANGVKEFNILGGTAAVSEGTADTLTNR